MAYTTQQLKESIERLYGDIDACITDLIRARLNKDAEGEGKALFKMEGLMVATEQELTCIGDYLEGKFEGVAQSYETGFAQGHEIGEREMADKACKWLTEHTFGGEYDCLTDTTSTTILYHGQRLLSTEFRKAMGLNSENCEK